MSNFKDHIKYYAILLVSIVSVIVAIGLALAALLLFLNSKILVASFCAAGAVLSFVLYKIMFTFRTNARNDVEYNEFGIRKGSEYKNLSAKQKKEFDLQILADNERIISTGELKKVTFKGSKDPEAELNKLIGLSNVKSEVLRMKAKMEYDIKYKRKDKSSQGGYHMCFGGSPGTGKTTVARIMAGFLFKYGCIKENKYIEVDSSFLKGSTPDLTLKRVKMILNRARGGVLFIDEAYSLMSGVNAAEIIAELVKYMEDHKKDFALILAGYQNDMEKLINSNPGLHSRISKYVHFRDYNLEELKDIFTAVANEAGYCVDASAYERFEYKIIQEMSSKNFGNARTVKNLLQQIMDNHAYNVMNGIISEEKAYMITGSDFK